MAAVLEETQKMETKTASMKRTVATISALNQGKENEVKELVSGVPLLCDSSRR